MFLGSQNKIISSIERLQLAFKRTAIALANRLTILPKAFYGFPSFPMANFRIVA
jgi:hypothetical protein